jgi:hypothetical protein
MSPAPPSGTLHDFADALERMSIDFARLRDRGAPTHEMLAGAPNLDHWVPVVAPTPCLVGSVSGPVASATIHSSIRASSLPWMGWRVGRVHGRAGTGLEGRATNLSAAAMPDDPLHQMSGDIWSGTALRPRPCKDKLCGDSRASENSNAVEDLL